MTEAVSNLLELQDHDTVIDQMKHRRDTLSEHSVMEKNLNDLGELERNMVAVRAEHDQLIGRQNELEKLIDAAQERRTGLDNKLTGGDVTAARDLQAVYEEIRHLTEHISQLEDQELEVMEALEPLSGVLLQADKDRSRLLKEQTTLKASISSIEKELDQAIEREMEVRARLCGEVSEPLLVLYEKLRKRLGGTGAARLVGNSCGGCHLVLPAMEVDKIRKSDPSTLNTCEQCGRIIVR